MNFFVTKSGKKMGPYSAEQLQIFLKQGLILPTDQVWAKGWTSWMPIENVPGLLSNRFGTPESSDLPPIPTATAARTVPQYPYAEGKNPVVACVLSLLIVGAGQIYNGDITKGICLLVTCVVCSFLSLGLAWFVWAIFSAHDAYRVAARSKTLYRMFPL